MFCEGRFWIAPDGTVHSVHAPCCHEEWANDVLGTRLESLFSLGWIRLQAFPQRYLFVDHGQQAVNPVQADALFGFFFDQQQQAIPYDRIVVERQQRDMREFQAGQNLAAYTFVCTAIPTGTENNCP